MARDRMNEQPRDADQVRVADTGRRARDLDDDRTRTVELREEELRARKERVQAGEVQITTDVVSEEKTIEVPVMHDEVTVERHAVDRRPSDRPIGEGETISVPLSEERVTFDKETVVYEELSIGKQAVQETERVSDTVRREVIDVDAEGDVDTRGSRAMESEPRVAPVGRSQGSGTRGAATDDSAWQGLRNDARDASDERRR